MTHVGTTLSRHTLARIVFIGLLAASALLSPALALFAGIALALTLGNPYPSFAKRASKIALQASVVGIGFGMNLHESLAAGRDGMLFTIVSVVGVMILGVVLGRLLGIDRKGSYLIASGTAICGGSAIAAVGPVIDADDDQMSLSLVTIFVLNAVALFIFPVIGHAMGLTQSQFGMWAAIAIHDTSSVVGAGAAYGDEALQIATTVKLTRALWIIPLALFSTFVFRCRGKRVTIPWFILLFVAAMALNTYTGIPAVITRTIVDVSHRVLCMTLFLIGCGLSMSVVRTVGMRPLLLGVALWAIISVATLAVITLL
ncbi:MAG: putative sulfate exporter family transporter [Alistipes sp.]|nr:putative sulfate exporter family transporter [Alistipes sp.]